MSYVGPPALVGTAVVAVLGLVVGFGVNALAARFPWQPRPGEIRRGPVRRPLVEVGTALLFALTALRFGPVLGAARRSSSWPAPACCSAVIDLRHKLLPNRVVLPSIGIGAVLLAVAALGTGEWPALRPGGAGRRRSSSSSSSCSC